MTDLETTHSFTTGYVMTVLLLMSTSVAGVVLKTPAMLELVKL